MLTHPLFDQLRKLRCNGMIEALEEQLSSDNINQLPFDERLAMLVERECLQRDNRRLQSRLRKAKFKYPNACLADINYKENRGLSKAVMISLETCQWVNRKQNVIITGPTGTGKTYLACALAHQGCLQDHSALYIRLTRLFPALVIAKADGSHARLMAQFAKVQLLILDDWGLATMDDISRRDLLELLDDRHSHSSTIVTSQLPMKMWHESIGDATLADAILDRLVHNAHKIELIGESMRKKEVVKSEI